MSSRDLTHAVTGVREPAKPSEILDAAAALVEPEGAWTTRRYARPGAGQLGCDPLADRATCFCMVGAIARVSASTVAEVEGENVAAIAFLRKSLGSWSAIGWNDRATQAEVVAKLREAAELARREGQ